MTTSELIRGFFAFLFAGAAWYAVFQRSCEDTGEDVFAPGRRRYAPYFPTDLLPGFLLALTVLSLLKLGVEATLEGMLSLCFGIFLHICLYYAVLLALLPLLRKYISARVCAALWLLPNYLYITQQSFMMPARPLWVLEVSGQTVRAAFCIWAAGFAAVMLWKLLSHLGFRRKLLRRAQPVTDRKILDFWKWEQRDAGFADAPYLLVTSPDTATPLSIGFFKWTTRVVLPERHYSPEELALILRHEMIHIGRQDCSTKFFLTFCTAMCWFNPLMWIAMRRSADDLELSCDETVLLGADDAARRRYADLLLRTAGDERGFTTCLSASAKALRYRLTNVIKPRKRIIGSFVLALTFFCLIVSCGYVAMAYDAAPGEQYLFDGQRPSDCTIESISWQENGETVFVQSTDEAPVTAYLAALECSRMTGGYEFADEDHRLSLTLRGPKGVFGITLADSTVVVTTLYGDIKEETYYICAPIDWQYLRSLLLTE